MIQVLISSDDHNHSAEDYALATAGAILPLDGLNAKAIDLARVRDLQTKFGDVLIPLFITVIENQRNCVASDPSGFLMSMELHQIANAAAIQLRAVAMQTFLSDVAAPTQWTEEVIKVIGSNLATAAHVENLLYARKTY